MRKEELTNSIDSALNFALANLHTMTVAQITKVGATTISCQPVINRVVNGESIPLPEFVEVPPIFLHGGASYLAMPLTVGDYCLLFFSERSYDKWYFGTDFESPIKPRMFDYSDGFALVGIQNQSGAITIPEVVTLIGDAFMQGNHEHVGDLLHTGMTTHNGDNTQTGNFINIGNLTRKGDEIVTGNRVQTGTLSASIIVSDNGWTGTFATGDSRTAVVQNGIIVSVS